MWLVSEASIASTQGLSEPFADARVIQFDPVKIDSRNGAGRFKEIAFKIKADWDLCTLEEKDIAAQVRKQARKAGVAMRRFSASPYAKSILTVIREKYELKEIGPYYLKINNSRCRFFTGASAHRIEISLNSDVVGKSLLALSKSGIKKLIRSQVKLHGGTMSDCRLSSVADNLYKKVRTESAAAQRRADIGQSKSPIKSLLSLLEEGRDPPSPPGESTEDGVVEPELKFQRKLLYPAQVRMPSSEHADADNGMLSSDKEKPPRPRSRSFDGSPLPPHSTEPWGEDEWWTAQPRIAASMVRSGRSRADAPPSSP